MVSFRTLNQSKKIDRSSLDNCWRSIFSVLLALDVLQYFQHNVDRSVDHRDDKRQQGQRFQQRHWASPGCGSQHPFRTLDGAHVLLTAAPTATPCFRRWRRSLPLLFAVRLREDSLLQKSSFPGLPFHPVEWFSNRVQKHDHLQCRQHLSTAHPGGVFILT